MADHSLIMQYHYCCLMLQQGTQLKVRHSQSEDGWVKWEMGE